MSFPSHQAAKSAQTRLRVINATIRCIVKFGYANITTPKIAAEAKLSRGAMRHHFKNSAVLIKAAIVELHERRLRAFRRSSETQSHDPSIMVKAYWDQLQKPTFIAFHEFALAARTSKKLAHILEPLQKEFRQRFLSEAFALFPEWSSDREGFVVAMTFTQTLLEGLAIRVHNEATDKEMVVPMLKLVENQIRRMNPALSIGNSDRVRSQDGFPLIASIAHLATISSEPDRGI
jgi:AcrR family transcriptional regulator